MPPNQPEHDPLFKIRPFYDHLRNIFPKLCVPNKNIAINEAMCALRGKLRVKVYIKSSQCHQTLYVHRQQDRMSMDLSICHGTWGQLQAP